MNSSFLFIFGLIAYLMQIFFCSNNDKTPLTFELSRAKGVYKMRKQQRVHSGDSFPIYGNSSSLNYYFVNIYLGTPPQKQSVIIDTGSHLTAVPCMPYIFNCGRHINAYYDTGKSNTSSLVDCNTGKCKQFSYARCEPDQKCAYTATYGEGSSLTGIFVEETILFGDTFHNFKPVSLPIGCTRTENKLFYDQDVDGIMGLGPGSTSFVNLLHQHSIIPHNLFSLCFAPDGGYFSIGGVNSTLHRAEVQYIQYYDSNFYKVRLQDVIVHSKDFMVNQKLYFTVIDSGTTLSFFPRPLYSDVEKQINAFCSQINRCLGDSYSTDLGLCYKLKENISITQFIESMPPLMFVFEGEVYYEWKPESYLFNYTESSTNDNRMTFCIGLAGWNSNEILLGSTWMHNHDIVFDIGGNRIGLVESNCAGVRKEAYNEDDFGFSLHQQQQYKLRILNPSCENIINVYTKAIIGVSVVSVVIIGVLVFLLNKIRRGKNFFWNVRDEEYISNLQRHEINLENIMRDISNRGNNS